jgi:hypothetical protein
MHQTNSNTLEYQKKHRFFLRMFLLSSDPKNLNIIVHISANKMTLITKKGKEGFLFDILWSPSKH